MTPKAENILSPRALRAELSARNLRRGETLPHEVSYGTIPSVLFSEDEDGNHGNFLPASYRRILARPAWAKRLRKSYTGTEHVPRAGDRRRGELECAASSDALLLNIFCYPGTLRRPAMCALLGVAPGLQPRFGVRAALPMRDGEIDRTELDMCLGTAVAEAKLTEGGFGRASRDRLLRYRGVEELFDLEALPQTRGEFLGYQLVRGILAALQVDGQYLVLLDGRRADLAEMCFRVLRAVRPSEVRHRLQLRTWQELAGTLPPVPQQFLEGKFGIVPG